MSFVLGTYFSRIWIRWIGLFFSLFGIGILWSVNLMDSVLVNLGFEIKNVWVEGRLKTSSSQILEVSGLKMGQSIWAQSLADIKERLEKKCPWIEKVIVQRRLPDTVLISLCEKTPLAIWHHCGQKKVIDHKGNVVEGVDPSIHSNFLIISGAHAPEHVSDLWNVLKLIKGRLPPIQKAVFLRSFRWDLHLQNGLIVKLPEENMAKALERLIQFWPKISNENPASVDLRFPEALVLQPQECAP